MVRSYEILVIDDMRSIHRSISEVLGERNCVVDYAGNGLLGLHLAQKKNYDLIILDIHLPDVNGLAICRELRNISAYEHRPILLLTSDTRNLEEGLMAGASDYILKPFNGVEMIARVFTQINLSQAKILMGKEKDDLKRNLEEEQRKLSEAQHDLQKYFYQSSHKLRSPLNSMKGLFDLLRLDTPEIVSNPYIKLLERAAKQMIYINEQVARIGQLRSLAPSYTTVNLSQFLNQMIGSGRFRNHRIAIDVSKEIEIVTDEAIFGSGLEPILDNAVFYAQRDTYIRPSIFLTTTEVNGATKLIIEDMGCGIRDEDLEKAFEMFFIGDEKSKGNGLGLYISKVALEKIGMQLTIESKAGHYTRVGIDLSNVIKNNTQNYEQHSISAKRGKEATHRHYRRSV